MLDDHHIQETFQKEIQSSIIYLLAYSAFEATDSSSVFLACYLVPFFNTNSSLGAEFTGLVVGGWSFIILRKRLCHPSTPTFTREKH